MSPGWSSLLICNASGCVAAVCCGRLAIAAGVASALQCLESRMLGVIVSSSICNVAHSMTAHACPAASSWPGMGAPS